MLAAPRVAYFSMEVGLDVDVHTYSGGLGVLAGDTIRAAADRALPMVAVTMLHRKGYFDQDLDADGNQSERPADWSPERRMQRVAPTVTVTVEGRRVEVCAWEYLVRGARGGVVPVYLLDTDLPANGAADRRLTDSLYGGNEEYRLAQEIVFGVGGVRMLRALGFGDIPTFHMNEGHAALLVLELMDAVREGRSVPRPEDLESARRRCVFTTHTPVPEGHDQYPVVLVERMLGRAGAAALGAAGCVSRDEKVNLTTVGLTFSRYANAVALRHRRVSEAMFPGQAIAAITNGAHAVTWTAPPFQALFDREIPGWREDNAYLRYAVDLDSDALVAAHAEAKAALLSEVERSVGEAFDPEALTIGFARRATSYKRHAFALRDAERLAALAERFGPLQFVYAGKAHPKDLAGKALIKEVVRRGRELGDSVRVVFLPGYDLRLARLITSGVDVWLNTPRKPQEASGTSGMKAAMNGVPSMSIHDGWWVEGAIEGVTGWTIGEPWWVPPDPDDEARSFYGKLERDVLPTFGDSARWTAIMRSCIALNGSFFNAHRMLAQYEEMAYRAGGGLQAQPA